MFFKLNMPSQRSYETNKIRIISLITSIVKINIIKFVLRIPISLEENVLFLEFSLKQSILLTAYKGNKRFLIILFVRNQLVTNFNAARQSLTALSHTF